MDDQLKDLHETNGYFVGIYRDEHTNSIKIEYPNDIIRDPNSKPTYTIYEILDNYVYKYNGDSDVANKIKSPIYAARLLVISDVLFTCVKLGLNSLLIINFDEKGNRVDDTMQLFDSPISKDDKELEQNLKVIFKQMMAGNTCNFLVDAGNVMDGYDLLLDVFRTGGF